MSALSPGASPVSHSAIARSDAVGWVRSPAFHQLETAGLGDRVTCPSLGCREAAELRFRPRSDYQACTAWTVPEDVGVCSREWRCRVRPCHGRTAQLTLEGERGSWGSSAGSSPASVSGILVYRCLFRLRYCVKEKAVKKQMNAAVWSAQPCAFCPRVCPSFNLGIKIAPGLKAIKIHSDFLPFAYIVLK